MLLTPKTYKAEKERLYASQQGICPICHRELDLDIQKNHLDHDHELIGPNAGKIRGLLCNLCNGSEGRTRHEFMRSGLAGRGIEYIAYLESLVAYLKQDTTANNLHPNLISDLKKRFSRMDKTGMMGELDSYGFVYSEDNTKAEMCKIFNKELPKHLKSKHNS